MISLLHINIFHWNNSSSSVSPQTFVGENLDPIQNFFKRKIQTLRDLKAFYRSLHGFIPFMARVIVCFLVFYWVSNVIISIAVVFHRRLQTSWKQLMSVLISSVYLLVLFWEAEMLLSLWLDYCFKVFWCEQKNAIVKTLPNWL